MLTPDALAIAKSVANRFSLSPACRELAMDADDIQQTAVLGLLCGIRTYDPNGGASLTTWLWKNAEWRVRKGVGEFYRRAVNREGARQTFHSGQLSEAAAHHIEQRLAIEDAPIDDVTALILERTEALTDARCARVLSEVLQGRSYRDIARDEGCSGSRVGQFVDRARGMLVEDRRVREALGTENFLPDSRTGV